MFQKPMNMLDELNRTLLITGLTCAIINTFFFRSGSAFGLILSIVAAATLIFAVIRLLGGHPERRNQENLKFLTGVTAVKNFFNRLFHASGSTPSKAQKAPRPRKAHKARKNPTWSEIKQYKYFMCPQCTQRLRVPRGKGKLRVTCTHCGNVFETKS